MPATFNMSDVMISYSRRDKAFVQRLNQSLQDSGRAVWVDWEDIPPTADWWSEIQAGIEAAHTFVFIITPESVRSEVCRREIDHAIACNKRLVPVLYKEIVDEADKAKMHPTLNTHNWIYLRDTDDFAAGFKILVLALETDLQHVQTHTRLLVRANEWEFKKRPNSLLLRGEDLKDAEHWLRHGHNKKPNPTELQADYIEASRAAANRFRTTVIGAMSAAMVILSLLACFAFSQANLAQTALHEAQVQGTEAANQAGIARENMVLAEGAENQRRIADAARETQVFIAQENQTLAADAATLAGNNQMTANAVATEAADIQNTANAAATQAANAQATAGTDTANLVLTSNAAGTLAVNANLKADDAQGTADSSGATAAAAEQTAIAQAATANAIGQTAVAQAATAAAAERTVVAQAATANANQMTATAAQITAVAVNVLGTQGALTATYAHDVARAFDRTSTPAAETALSISLALNAQTALEAGDRPLAMHLALLAVKRPGLEVYADPLVEQIFYQIASSTGLRQRIDTGSLVNEVAYSPDGKSVVMGLRNGTLQSWNLATGSIEIIWQKIGTAVTSVTFSKSGRYIAFGAGDSYLRLWDVQSKSLVSEADAQNVVLSVAFSPDERLVVSGAYLNIGNNVRLWEITAGSQLRDLNQGNRTASIESVAYSPDGKYVALGTFGGMALLEVTKIGTYENYNAPDGNPDNDIEYHNVGEVYSIAFGPAGKCKISATKTGTCVASGANDNLIRLWDAETGEQVGQPWVGHTLLVRSIAFSQDGTLAISSSLDTTLRLWSVETGKQIGTAWVGHLDDVISAAFSPDERYVVSGSTDSTVRLWDLTHDQSDVKVWHGAPTRISSIAFNASGDRVVSGTSNGGLQLWDARTGSILATSNPNGENIEVAFSPTGNYLVAGSSDDGVVQMWDMSSPTPFNTPMWTIQTNAGINSVAFSPNGNHIVVGAGFYFDEFTGYVTVLNSDGTLLQNSIFQNSVVYQAVFSRTRSCTTTSCPVFLALRNGTLRQIDAITGSTIGTPLTGHNDIIWSTDVSPYMKCRVSVLYLGNCVVTGARDRTIRLWNVSTNQPIGGAWLGHREEILAIVFSPDGKRVVSGSGDQTVRLWDVVTGQQLGNSWVGHEGSVTNLAFSRDGNFLVSGSDDGTLRLWNVRDLHELAAWFCGNRYARYLTDDELQKYGVSRTTDNGLANQCAAVAKNPPTIPSLAGVSQVQGAQTAILEVTAEVTPETTVEPGIQFASDTWMATEQGWTIAGGNEINLLTSTIPIDLRSIALPQLHFRSQVISQQSLATVQISTDGQNWILLKPVLPNETWSDEIVDLSAYTGQQVWLQFVWFYVPSDPADSWSIEHIHIIDASVIPTITPSETVTATFTAEATTEATGEVTAEVTVEATLTETPTLEPTLTETPTSTPTLEPTLTATPTLEPILPTATLMLPPIAPPLFASMDDGAPFWTARGGWQLSDTLRYGETGLGWFAAPEMSTLTWEQPLDLRLSAAPQLRFMSLLNAANGSLAAVEISTDGANWIMQAVVTPSALWQETALDLSAYRGQVIWIRFTWLWQAAAAADAPIDFWVLDAVSAVDAPPVIPTFPPTATVFIEVIPTAIMTPTLTLAPVVEVTPEITAEATGEATAETLP